MPGIFTFNLICTTTPQVWDPCLYFTEEETGSEWGNNFFKVTQLERVRARIRTLVSAGFVPGFFSVGGHPGGDMSCILSWCALNCTGREERQVQNQFPSQRCCLRSLDLTPHPSRLRDGAGLGLGCPRGLHQEPPIPGLPWAGPALLCPEATGQ